MNLKYVEWKNFGCYGNKMQRLDFSKGSSFNLIQAKNGHGKSTIKNIIEYSLYGKVAGLALKDLVNRINGKDMRTNVKLSVGKNKLYLEKGLATKHFKAELNGKHNDRLPSQYQKMLENEVYPLPYSVFSNIVSVSVKDLKSFINLEARDKTLITDKIFGTDIVNTVNKKFKELNKTIVSKNDKLKILIENKQTEIFESNEEIEANKKNVTVNTIDVELNKTNLKKVRDVLKQLQKKIQQSNNNYQTFQNKISRIEEKKAQTVKHLNLLTNNESCPVCSGSLNDHTALNLKSKLDGELEKYTGELTNLYKLSEDSVKSIRKFQDLKTKFSKQEQKFRSKINEGLTVNNSDVNALLLMVTKYETALNLLEIEYNSLQDDIEYYSTALKIFSNDGIKREMNKSIITPLNRIIYRNCRQLNFDFQIKFDEDFNTEIKNLGHVINHNTMSDGEMNKANIIVILAFIELVKVRYPSFNIMFLDEVFTSLDDDNIHMVLGILKNITRKYKFNCFIVTHYPIDVHYFDKIITINKKNGFSRIEIKKQ